MTFSSFPAIRFVAALALPALSVVALAQDPATPPALGYRDSFQTNYTSSFIGSLPLMYVTNPGFHTAGLGFLGSGGSPQADMCVNIYTFRPDQTFINCCSCRITPNGLLALTGNSLYPGITGSVSSTGSVVKLVASVAKPAPGVCDPTAAPQGLGNPGGYASGMRGWVNHSLNFTEMRLEPVPLGADEQNKLVGLCRVLPVISRCACPTVAP